MKYMWLIAGPLALGMLLAGTAEAAEPAAVAPPTRMDQVQREAVNPMRRILEAATVVRSKVRVVEPTRPAPAAGAAPAVAAAAGNAPAATPAGPGAVAQRSAVTAAAGAGRDPQSAEAAAPAVQINRSLAASPAAPAPTEAAARAAAEPLAAPAAVAGDTTARRPESSANTAAVATEPPAPPVLLAAAAPVTAPSPAAQALARTAAVAAETPEMLSMVEPVVPSRLRSRLPPELRLRLDLTIERDGSVREVALLGPVDRQLAPLVVGAVRQWRYAPLREPRTHNVELLLNFTE